MRESFKGWRRKAGVVTLVMACCFAGVWVRSQIKIDEFQFMIGRHQNIIISSRGELVWIVAEHGRPQWKYRNRDTRETIANEEYVEVVKLFDRKLSGRKLHATWCVPYVLSIPLLTLLSAYLILWKPRPKERRDA